MLELGEVIGHSLVVAISFLKIRDGKRIQPWSLALVSLLLSWKASGEKTLFYF